MEPETYNIKVLIIGGGPVGLFTGIKFLEKNFSGRKNI